MRSLCTHDIPPILINRKLAAMEDLERKREKDCRTFSSPSTVTKKELLLYHLGRKKISKATVKAFTGRKSYFRAAGCLFPIGCVPARTTGLAGHFPQLGTVGHRKSSIPPDNNSYVSDGDGDDDGDTEARSRKDKCA